MNQAQRNFLIKKIEETIKTQIKCLESEEEEYPNLSNYLLHQVMSNTFELQPIEHIRKAIINMALNAKAGEGWMNKDRWGDSNPKITFHPKDIFVIPESYRELQQQVMQKNDRIREEVRMLSIQAESLILRIQLASDKTLQTMINEVDDMGNISLMDTKIKQLSNG